MKTFLLLILLFNCKTNLSNSPSDYILFEHIGESDKIYKVIISTRDLSKDSLWVYSSVIKVDQIIFNRISEFIDHYSSMGSPNLYKLEYGTFRIVNKSGEGNVFEKQAAKLFFTDLRNDLLLVKTSDTKKILQPIYAAIEMLNK